MEGTDSERVLKIYIIKKIYTRINQHHMMMIRIAIHKMVNSHHKKLKKEELEIVKKIEIIDVVAVKLI